MLSRNRVTCRNAYIQASLIIGRKETVAPGPEREVLCGDSTSPSYPSPSCPEGTQPHWTMGSEVASVARMSLARTLLLKASRSEWLASQFKKHGFTRRA